MNYENKKKAMHLALVGSIKEEILPTLDMANYLLDFFKEHYPAALKERFNIEEITENHLILEQIASKRGLLGPNGVLLVENAASLLLKEFKDGKLGRISLERAL